MPPTSTLPNHATHFFLTFLPSSSSSADGHLYHTPTNSFPSPSPSPPSPPSKMGVSQNPYASLTASAPSAPAAPAASSASASAAPSKPRDQVLSRVQKRAQISKPPVKFSMTPRYRFALPDPPADLKMMRGSLAPSAAAALRMTRLESDAKKAAVPLHPSFGLRADLVLPAQYAPRPPGAITPEDQVVLAAVEGRGGDGGKKGATRAVATAFPWMRRMGYDEYAKGTGERSKREEGTGGQAGEKRRLEKMEEERRRDHVQTFAKARIPVEKIRHPEPSKKHLTAVSAVPVFRDMNDCDTDLISLQFDMMAPLERVDRFAGDEARGEEAFKSAVSISVSDEKDKKFLSCFVPDDATLRDLEAAADDPEPAERKEYHDRLREFAIREAGVAPAQQGSAVARSTRPKLTFVGNVRKKDGNDSMMTLSGIPTAWLLTPRTATMKPLGEDRLELDREVVGPELKRRKLDKVQDNLFPKKR